MGKGDGYRPGGQSGAQLSNDEQAAVKAKAAGEPYDQKAYKRAQQKIKRAEKYQGNPNAQKRSNNYKTTSSTTW
jgi:hypothetical protein